MKFDVLRPLTFDGKKYLPGSEVDFSKAKKETADELLKLKVIAVKESKVDAEAKTEAKAEAKTEDGSQKSELKTNDKKNMGVK